MKAISFLIFLSVLSSCGFSTSESKVEDPETVLKLEEITVTQQPVKSLDSIQEKRNADKNEHLKSDLTGMWWTRYFAQRKIHFYDDGAFKLNPGNDKLIKGTFNLLNRKVELEFETNEKMILNLSGGNDEYSYILIGEGYTYVKEWEQ